MQNAIYDSALAVTGAVTGAVNWAWPRETVRYQVPEDEPRPASECLVQDEQPAITERLQATLEAATARQTPTGRPGEWGYTAGQWANLGRDVLQAAGGALLGSGNEE